ncbi:MAG: cytochrome c [Bacteroidota bacterium]
MSKILLFIFFGATLSLVSLSYEMKNNFLLDEVNVEELPVELVLSNISGEVYKHAISKLDMEKAELGKQLITKGKAKSKSHKGKLISKYYTCTDCHNLVKETEIPTDLNPHARLAYAQKNNLPFLPASTFWGIYNRTTFFNQDYVKRFGDKIKNAKDSLTNAIQVCAKYSSSGRFLEGWEVEAILHYFKKNELKIKDLNLGVKVEKNILYWQKLDQTEKTLLKVILQANYIQSYPATFVPTITIDQRKYGEGANAIDGEIIFSRACLHCHAGKRVSGINLEKSSLTANLFWKNIEDYSSSNLYQLVRWGTYTKSHKKKYMPHYTKEKMSDEQIEDLVAYIKKISKK